MVRDTKTGKRIECPRNGCGVMSLHPIMDRNELGGKVTLFARVVLEPKSEIGFHQHIGETEAYYVISGEGYFLDSDGTAKRVQAGDICTIREGESHGMRNTGTEQMKLIALVLE